jgi:hypothetical protein
MSSAESSPFSGVLETVKSWPPHLRVSLARAILESVQSGESSTTGGKASGRGRPVEELIGLGAGSSPPPSDDVVRQWIGEHREEKFAR